jgi:hypothetical protein
MKESVMKSAWRELLSKVAIACIGIGSLIAISGCQSWSPSGWGMPTSTRVAPPPTGTVKSQGDYYSNPPMGKVTTQLEKNSSAPVVQASSVNPFGSNGSMPATNLNTNAGAFSTGATSIVSQGASGQVSTAGYNDNGSGMAQVISAGSLQGSANYNSDTGIGANSNAGEAANLQWTAK